MMSSMWADSIEDVQRQWKWFLLLGIALIVLGMVALGASVVVTLASVLFFGLLFIISGIFQAVQSIPNQAVERIFSSSARRPVLIWWSVCCWSRTRQSAR